MHKTSRKRTNKRKPDDLRLEYRIEVGTTVVRCHSGLVLDCLARLALLEGTIPKISVSEYIEPKEIRR